MILTENEVRISSSCTTIIPLLATSVQKMLVHAGRARLPLPQYAAGNGRGCRRWVEGCCTSTHCSGTTGINYSHYGNQRQLVLLLNKRISLKYHGPRADSSYSRSWPGLGVAFQLKYSWVPALLLLRQPETVFPLVGNVKDHLTI